MTGFVIVDNIEKESYVEACRKDSWMTNSSEEIARRKRIMAEARARADQMLDNVTFEHQAKIASAIRQSIADAPPSMTVEEAQEMLSKFDEDR